jgi:hypothetical protein
MRALDRVVVKAAARLCGSSEARALTTARRAPKVSDVMAGPADYLRLEARTAEARFSGWIHATNPRSYAWPLRRGVTEAVLASRFTKVSSRNGPRRSSRTIGPLVSVVNRQSDESSAVRTSTTRRSSLLSSARRPIAPGEMDDARARSVSAASSYIRTRSYVTRRWLKVNCHDEATSIGVVYISRKTECK